MKFEQAHQKLNLLFYGPGLFTIEVFWQVQLKSGLVKV